MICRRCPAPLHPLMNPLAVMVLRFFRAERAPPDRIMLAPRLVSIRSLAGPSRHRAGITGVSFLNFAACVGFGFCRSILIRSQTGRGHMVMVVSNCGSGTLIL